MKEIVNREKTTALLLIIAIVLNLFSPYLTVVSNAAVDTSLPYLSIVNGYDENAPDFEDVIKLDYEDYGIIPIYLVLGGTKSVNGLDINFSYDTDVLTPAYNAGSARKPNYKVANSMTDWEPMESVISSTYSDNNTCLFTSEGRIRMEGTLSSKNPSGDTITIAVMYFFVNDGYTPEDITSDMFNLVTGASGLATGLEIVYEVTNSVYGVDHFMVEGFTETGVEIDSMTVTNPTTIDYEHGDTININGSIVTINYSDESSYTDTLEKAISDGKVTIDTTTADVNNPQFVVVSVEDTTVSQTINLTVTDPIKTLELTTSPSIVSYNTGDAIDLNGGVVTATTKSGVVTTITLPDSDVTSDTTTADINSSNIQNTWTASSGLTAGTQKITLSYTDSTNTTKQVSYTIVVNDTISSVDIKTNPSTLTYKYGDNFNKTGGEITVNTTGGGSFDLSMTDGAVSITGYISKPTTLPSSQNISINYSGITATSTIPVVVKNYVSEIVIAAPTKNIYKYGEALDYTDGYYAVKYGDSTTGTSFNMTSSEVSGYSPTTVGSQTLIVTYTDTDIDSYTYGQSFTKTFNVTVNDYVSRIEIIAPTDVNFNYGDTFTVNGGSINAYYASAPTNSVNIPFTTSMVRQSNADPIEMSPATSNFDRTTHTYQESLTITVTRGGLTETKDYTITIFDNLDSIELTSQPTKLQYNVSEEFDSAGGKVTLTRASGYTKEIDLSNCVITGFDSSAINPNQTLIISYTDPSDASTTKQDTTNLVVSIEDNITGIAIKTQPSKKVYKYNEELDVTGGTITVTKGSGTQDIQITKGMVSGYDKTKLGEQELTITYGGQTVTYKVKVKDYVTKIEVNPSIVTGEYNDTLADILNDNNIKYIVTYAKAGAKTPVALTTDMVQGYNETSIVAQNLTVTYTDKDADSCTNGQSFTTTLNVTLSDVIDAITITAPTKTKYNHGEGLDLAGGTITVKTASGASKTVQMTESMLTEGGSTVNMSPDAAAFGTNTTLNKTLTIKYTEGGKTGIVNYPITIVNDVRSISMHQTPKTEYNVNDTIDVTNGEILVTRALGTPEAVSLSDSKVAVTGFNSAVEATNLPLTVTYTENGISKTTSYNVNVKDSVTGIAIKTQPSKTEYKYNEPLDVTGGTITVTKGSGTQDIAITEGMVSGYNKEKLGEQELTITYGGQTATYKVKVKDYVTKIEVNPSIVTGEYNDTLADLINDNNIKYIVTYAKAGAKTPVALTTDMVQGYNETSIVEQNLTVTYTDKDVDSYTNGQPFTTTLKITLTNIVTGITITAPSKTTYNHGDSLDLTGGKIELTYADGTKGTVPMTTAMIKETDGSTVEMSPDASKYGSDYTLSKTLKIEYTQNGKTGTASYPITIINNVKSIKVHKTPTKVAYNVNDSLDVTGGEILVTRATGTPEVKSMTNSMVTNFDSTTENTALKLNVEYTENGITKTTDYTVSIRDSVTGIAIKTQPSKKVYKYNEELDVTGGTITVTKGSGTQDIAITESMVSGYDKTKLGEQELTITYGGQTVTYKVKVKDYVTKIEVNPSIVTGEYNDTLADLINDNNIKYTVTYAKAGAKTPVALTTDMVQGYNETSIVAQNLTVIYTDKDADSYTNGQPFTTTLNVTLSDSITGIAITNNPNKLGYGYNETLDTTGGVITVTKTSGETKPISFNEPGVTLTETDGSALDLTNVTFDSNNKATKTIQVNYQGQKATFTIQITNKITGIVMENTPKTNYKVGESLDLTTDGTTLGTILVTRQNGDIQSIKLDNANVQVTGFDSSVENTNLSLTVSYTENQVTKTTNYTISVIDNVINVEIKDTPKTNYKYGESLDVSTGTLEITKDSGKTIIPITPNMVTEVDGTPFDSTKLGTRNLKVTYGGIDMTYEITVSDYVKGIVLTPPTKLTYEYGESLDLTGGYIKKIMASGQTVSQVLLSDSSVTISGYNPNIVGAQTVTVSYEGYTETFGVIVEDNIQSIEITTLPTKTQYKYGDSLDVTGGKITATRSSGNTEIINITPSMVTGFNPNQLGAQTLIVTYKGKTDTYNVNVEDYITDISIVKPTKLIYKVGESIDLTGGQVNLTMASGQTTSPVAMSNANVTITGFDTTSVGAKTITVEYSGFTKTFGITVVDPLSDVVLKTLPNKTNYLYNEALDLTGATLEITKESGEKYVINVTKDMVSGYNPKVLGPQTITVTYEGFTQQFTVNVQDYVSSLKVTKPDKLEYEYGESIDLTNGKVSIVMASGAIKETVDMTASMISGFNSKQEGTQTIQVEYKGLQGNFQVKVIDKIKGISLNTEPNKKDYNYGEDLDLTGGTITVVKSSGITIIPITKDMVSGYDATTPGSQIINVTYGGFTTKFLVNVNKQTIIVDKEETEEPEQTEEKINKVINITATKDEIIEEITEEKSEEDLIETPVEPPVTEVEKEKPTQTLGVKDDNTEETNKVKSNKIIAAITGLIGLIFMFLLIFFKRNVKVYVEEDEEFVLGGLDKITKKNPKLDIDQYLDGNTYPNRVKIHLNDSISEKLDGKEIEIKHRGKTIKHKVKYNDEPYEFILE